MLNIFLRTQNYSNFSLAHGTARWLGKTLSGGRGGREGVEGGSRGREGRAENWRLQITDHDWAI